MLISVQLCLTSQPSYSPEQFLWAQLYLFSLLEANHKYNFPQGKQGLYAGFLVLYHFSGLAFPYTAVSPNQLDTF